MLLTKKEAADILKVCPATVRRMMKRGDLKGFRVGKITRITRQSLEHLIGQPIPRRLKVIGSPRLHTTKSAR